MRVHLLVNLHRTDAIEAARSASKWLHAQGFETATDHDGSHHLHIQAVDNAAFGEADLVICFGGDGTLIRGAYLCSATGTPILGVYYGRFGFVTQASGREVKACVRDFFDKKLEIEERMMLQAELIRGDESVASIHALNETVLQRAADVNMLTFDVEIDGRHLATYPADGVMVATPTGSTGYNLSAGGPIVDPKVQALILTAVSPHTLGTRPLVLQSSSEVQFRVTTRGEAVLTADGQTRFHLLTADKIRITKSPRVTRLVSVEKQDFLIKVSERMFWSHSMPDGVSD